MSTKQNAPHHPKAMEGVAIDKAHFASAMHRAKLVLIFVAVALTPAACTSLTGWELKPVAICKGCHDV